MLFSLCFHQADSKALLPFEPDWNQLPSWKVEVKYKSFHHNKTRVKTSDISDSAIIALNTNFWAKNHFYTIAPPKSAYIYPDTITREKIS